MRSLGALLMEIDEKWSTGSRYLNMEEYWVWRQEQEELNQSVVQMNYAS
jgi:putative transposase